MFYQARLKILLYIVTRYNFNRKTYPSQNTHFELLLAGPDPSFPFTIQGLHIHQPDVPVVEGRKVISRYTRPEMGRIWSDENKFRMWLKVEIAASLVLAETGILPPDAPSPIPHKGHFHLQP